MRLGRRERGGLPRASASLIAALFCASYGPLTQQADLVVRWLNSFTSLQPLAAIRPRYDLRWVASVVVGGGRWFSLLTVLPRSRRDARFSFFSRVLCGGFGFSLRRSRARVKGRWFVSVWGLASTNDREKRNQHRAAANRARIVPLPSLSHRWRGAAFWGQLRLF